jgi:hypothetical protein
MEDTMFLQSGTKIHHRGKNTNKKMAVGKQYWIWKIRL